MTQNLCDVVERLSRLEQQNRLLKHGLLLILLVFGGVFLMGQAAPASKTIEGREIILRDDAGTARLTLRVTKGGPIIGLFDSKGKVLAGLGGMEFGANFSLYDEKNRPRVMVGSMPNVESGLVIYDEDGETVFSKP